MELSPKLNTSNFGWSDKYSLRNCLSQINKEEIEMLEDEISKILDRNFAQQIDDDIWELYKNYPKPFRTSTRAVLSSKVLGITEDTYYTHIEDKNSIHISGTHNFNVRQYPTKGREVFTLTEEGLKKFDKTDLEQIRSLYSRYLELQYQRDFELRKFDDIKDSIKTIGRLYRVNQSWYETLVREKYPDEAFAKAAPKATGKRGPATKLDEKTKSMLEDLKDILDL